MRIALLAGALALATPAAALQNRIGASAAEFLRLGAGARSLGMGEASVAVTDGPEAAYWNPSGLAHTHRLELGYTRAELPAGLHHDYLAVAVPASFLGGTLGFSFTRLSQDSLEAVDAANRAVGSFSPHSEAVAFSYGREFLTDDPNLQNREYFGDKWETPNFQRPMVEDQDAWTGQLAGGLTAKIVNENLGTRSASTFACDAGLMFRGAEFKELMLGAAIRNIGGRLRFISESEPLPAEGALGLAYDARYEDWRMLTAVEGDVPYAGTFYGKLGGEASRRLGKSTWVSMRLGYNSRTSVDLGPLSGLTTGVGLRVSDFSVNAAFQLQDALGQALRFGVEWRY